MATELLKKLSSKLLLLSIFYNRIFLDKCQLHFKNISILNRRSGKRLLDGRKIVITTLKTLSTVCHCQNSLCIRSNLGQFAIIIQPNSTGVSSSFFWQISYRLHILVNLSCHISSIILCIYICA